MARFAFEEDRKQALLTRVMVRHVLTEVTDGAVRPEAWQIARTASGRPFLPDPLFQALSFNVSHTRALVVCAVAARGTVGVDIEALTRRAPLEIAPRYFSRSEASALGRLPPRSRSRRFFEYWTLKEAFVKATGQGLTLPLSRFSFEFRPDGAFELVLSPELVALGEDSRCWQFFSRELAPSHLLALALRAPGVFDAAASSEARAPLEVRFHPAAPLLNAAAAAASGVRPRSGKP